MTPQARATRATEIYREREREIRERLARRFGVEFGLTLGGWQARAKVPTVAGSAHTIAHDGTPAHRLCTHDCAHPDHDKPYTPGCFMREASNDQIADFYARAGLAYPMGEPIPSEAT